MKSTAMTELNVIDNGETKNDHIVAATTTASVRIRAPKRILHFSDGTLEEYSDDDVDASEQKNANNNNDNQEVDINRLEWGPWMIHRALDTGNRLLTACDYVGEKITAILGITTPKYSYEIKQFQKMENERIKQLEEEQVVGGWMQATNSKNVESKDPHRQVCDAPEKCITTQDGLQRY